MAEDEEDDIVERFKERESRRVGLEALAEQLCTRLDAVESDDARTLAEEGRKSAQRFSGWTDRPPPLDQRSAVLSDMMGFNVRALEYLRDVESDDVEGSDVEGSDAEPNRESDDDI